MENPSFLSLFVKLTGLQPRHEARTNYFVIAEETNDANQAQTNNSFSEKWNVVNRISDRDVSFEWQKNWYLSLYGFFSEADFETFLKNKSVIFDAGCGLGYKAAWFAQLAPKSLVIGMDFSEAAELAAKQYEALPNLFFIRGDIANTVFPDACIDYVSCDQVIQHTEDPEKTFAELARITKEDGEFACYFYAKKALPRELVDDYFRVQCTKMSSEQVFEMSQQLTELGKRLSELNVSFACPEIPALGIKGGSYDIQRFIYWNFLKCFWNAEMGKEISDMTNFDWYSPSNAQRFSEEEVNTLVRSNKLSLTYFHQEEACYAVRALK